MPTDRDMLEDPKGNGLIIGVQVMSSL